MTNLIDHTYFTRDIIKVPQRSEVIERLNDAISINEPIYLDRLLGSELHEQFIQGLDNPVPDAKWIELRDIIVNADTKLSAIAYYVYVKFYTANQSIFTGLGDVKPNVENGIIADRYKIVNAWNKMVVLNTNIYNAMVNSSYEYDVDTDLALYNIDTLLDV